MKEFSYTITNEYDLAAKPAFDLIKLAGEHGLPHVCRKERPCDRY